MARSSSQQIRISLVFGFCAAVFLSVLHPAFGLDQSTKQVVVAIASNWDSKSGTLELFERTENGNWTRASEASKWSVLFGKKGLAWGRGIEDYEKTQSSGPKKKERDGRAPAGVFDIGKIYTYDPALPEGANYPYHTVTALDAWIDDPTSTEYNKFVSISDPKNPPPWFKKNRMRLGDFAYRWLVEIKHNSDEAVPGAGSAIFFHIRRGETRPTTGCTTMAETDLVRLIKWLRENEHPRYVLLTKNEYIDKWKEWDLPDPALVFN